MHPLRVRQLCAACRKGNCPVAGLAAKVPFGCTFVRQPEGLIMNRSSLPDCSSHIDRQPRFFRHCRSAHLANDARLRSRRLLSRAAPTSTELSSQGGRGGGGVAAAAASRRRRLISVGGNVARRRRRKCRARRSCQRVGRIGVQRVGRIGASTAHRPYRRFDGASGASAATASVTAGVGRVGYVPPCVLGAASGRARAARGPAPGGDLSGMPGPGLPGRGLCGAQPDRTVSRDAIRTSRGSIRADGKTRSPRSW